MPFPKNADEMWAAGYTFLDHGQCEGCDQAIEFWLTPGKRRISVNPMPTEEAKARLHLQRCGQAERLRRKAS